VRSGKPAVPGTRRALVGAKTVACWQELLTARARSGMVLRRSGEPDGLPTREGQAPMRRGWLRPTAWGYRALAIWAACALICAGCGTTRQSDTPRTGIEQLLISTAVDQVLQQVDFSPLAGRNVYVESRYLDCVDKNYIVASVRHHLLLAGARLKEKRDQADVVLELRAGAVGTDREDLLIGLNKLPLPQTQQLILPVALPDAPLITKSAQKATVKLGMVAYDARTGQLFADAGLQASVADHQQWIILGLGPIRSGSVYRELRRLQGRNTLFARIEGLLLDDDDNRAEPASAQEPTLEGELVPVRGGSSEQGQSSKSEGKQTDEKGASGKR